VTWLARLFSLLVLAWAFGFLWFVLAEPGPAGEGASDAVVVPTGAGGRIQRGLAVLEAGQAGRMLVSGVDPEVRPGEFAAEYRVGEEQMRCCITLDQQAVDTHGNARETAAWMAENRFTTLRLVTSDWHMRRASLELRRALPPEVTMVEDAVPTPTRLDTLFLEYHKFLAVLVGPLLGRG